MSDDNYDYTPRPTRGRKAKPAASPPAARKREAAEEDYTPRPARREPSARAARGAGDAPRSARPARKKRPASRPPQRIKWGSLLRSRALMTVVGIVGLLVLVVVPVVGELTRGGTSAPTGSPVGLGDQYYDEGLQLWNQGDAQGAVSAFQQAAAYYEQALVQTPEDAQVRTNLGTMYLYQGQLQGDTTLVEKAIQVWNVALDYEPNKPETLVKLGLGYAALGQVPRAMAMWQQVIAVAPGSESAQSAQQLIQEYSAQPTVTP